MLKISFIAIGNELLKGFIVNTNAARAGQILRNQGLSLHRVLTIGDTKEAIMAAVEAELAESDVVLMSGGLGPTKDDITKSTFIMLGVMSSGTLSVSNKTPRSSISESTA